MSLSVIEDIESGKEFERIKQNFTPTPPDPDVLANLAEIQTAFEDLQSELHDFLAKYTDKLMGLQTRIPATSLPSTTSHESDTHKTVVPTAMTARTSRHSTVDAQHTIEDSLSDRMLSVKPTLKVENIPLDAHLRHLQTFLNAQMDNIRRLHDASHSPTTQMTHKEEKPMPSGESDVNKIHEKSKTDIDFNRTLSSFVLMAALIVLFLLLVMTIIGTKHRTPFSVAMFFSFLSLSALFIGILVIKYVVMMPQSAKEKMSVEGVNFYVQHLEQLQLIAVILFIISITVTLFIIFASIAFALVVLFLSGLGALIVFASVHWEVAITFKNIQYMAKNIRRLRTAVEFIKYNRKATKAIIMF